MPTAMSTRARAASIASAAPAEAKLDARSRSDSAPARSCCSIRGQTHAARTSGSSAPGSASCRASAQRACHDRQTTSSVRRTDASPSPMTSIAASAAAEQPLGVHQCRLPDPLLGQPGRARGHPREPTAGAARGVPPALSRPRQLTAHRCEARHLRQQSSRSVLLATPRERARRPLQVPLRGGDAASGRQRPRPSQDERRIDAVARGGRRLTEVRRALVHRRRRVGKSQPAGDRRDKWPRQPATGRRQASRAKPVW